MRIKSKGRRKRKGGGMGWDGKGWEGMEGKGWEGKGWDGMGWDAKGCEGMRRDAKGCVTNLHSRFDTFYIIQQNQNPRNHKIKVKIPVNIYKEIRKYVQIFSKYFFLSPSNAPPYSSLFSSLLPFFSKCTAISSTSSLPSNESISCEIFNVVLYQ